MAERPAARPENDIYTVLLIVATAFVVLGLLLVAVRSAALFGTWLPF